MAVLAAVAYWLAEHPAIVGFRWSPSDLWFSTWAFLMGFLASYVALSLALDAFLGSVLRHRRPLKPGPVPAAHALLMAAFSAVIFSGTLLSTVAEIRDTRWSWQGRATPRHSGYSPVGVGVVWMHFGGIAGGCSGIGAWVFNTLLNAALFWVFLHCYGKRGACDDDDL